MPHGGCARLGGGELGHRHGTGHGCRTKLQELRHDHVSLLLTAFQPTAPMRDRQHWRSKNVPRVTITDRDEICALRLLALTSGVGRVLSPGACDIVLGGQIDRHA
jgi:hypothetical protein